MPDDPTVTPDATGVEPVQPSGDADQTALDLAQDQPPADQPPAQPADDVAALKQRLDTLEKRYSDSSAEALRLYRENQTLKSQPPGDTKPKYTREQLVGHKATMLSNLASGELTAEDRAKASQTIVWCDEEVRKLDRAEWEQTSKAGQGVERVRQRTASIVQQHAAEFQPGGSLHQPASECYGELVAAGYPENEATVQLACERALLVSGTLTKGASTSRSKEISDKLKQATAGAAVSSGGGGNPKPSGRYSAQDIMNMSDEDFSRYRQQVANLA